VVAGDADPPAAAPPASAEAPPVGTNIRSFRMSELFRIVERPRRVKLSKNVALAEG
jgi:hypothetical protein